MEPGWKNNDPSEEKIRKAKKARTKKRKFNQKMRRLNPQRRRYGK